MAERPLPELRDAAAFDQLLPQAERWQPALSEICRRHGLDPDALAPVAGGSSVALVDELHACLASEAPVLAAETDAVLMHCELMPGHLLVEPTGENWHISGLIDFGDPLVGHHAYEFGGVFVFFTAGQPALRRAFLQAYGYDDTSFGPELARRLMAAALLHRFGTVPLGLRLMRAQDIRTSFYETFFCLKP